MTLLLFHHSISSCCCCWCKILIILALVSHLFTRIDVGVVIAIAEERDWDGATAIRTAATTTTTDRTGIADGGGGSGVAGTPPTTEATYSLLVLDISTVPSAAIQYEPNTAPVPGPTNVTIPPIPTPTPTPLTAAPPPTPSPPTLDAPLRLQKSIVPFAPVPDPTNVPVPIPHAHPPTPPPTPSPVVAPTPPPVVAPTPATFTYCESALVAADTDTDECLSQEESKLFLRLVAKGKDAVCVSAAFLKAVEQAALLILVDGCRILFVTSTACDCACDYLSVDINGANISDTTRSNDQKLRIEKTVWGSTWPVKDQ
jgi:hypothetical protein